MTKLGNGFDPGIIPAGHRLVVWPKPAERTTNGGIVIPETHAGREDLAQIEATVIQIGPSAWRDQPGPWCKEGDAILMSKFAGYIWKGTDGRDYRVINDLDVVAVREAM